MRLPVAGGLGALLVVCTIAGSSAGTASAQQGPFGGPLPPAGGLGIVTWSGGSVAQLQVDAEAGGCRPRAVWANGSGGTLVVHLFGAPGFVNAGFEASYPAGLGPGAPIILVCAAVAPPPGARFETLPVGATLPSGAECAARVRPTSEIRAGNAVYNATRGSSPHDTVPRVDGDFTGTTDEIIQWAACKWGIDEDIARAQVAIESWWRQTTGGDRTSDPSICHPDLREPLPCPESIGLMQVRYQYHGGAFEDSNAIRSSSYNVDYAYSVWRSCYEGELTWLNTVERGTEYAAGDVWGCLGVWFSGRWYTSAALEYNARVRDYLDQRIWETEAFRDP